MRIETDTSSEIWKAKSVAWQYATAVWPGSNELSSEVEFYGPVPIERLSGRDGVADGAYEPLQRAFPDAMKVPYLFCGGVYDNRIWVASTGNIIGRMDANWLGVPKSNEVRQLRFGEFYAFEDGKIVDIRCLLDIPELAAQAGINLFHPYEGRGGFPPGPADGDGVVGGCSDAAETEFTRNLVAEMIGGCNQLEGSDLSSQGMERFWHDTMVWHGPWGIGSSYGLAEFYKCAQGPSVKSFPNRRGAWPKVSFVAEGRVAAHTGWPGFLGEFKGEPFLGMPPTQTPISKTVMDFYIRRGDKLAENWVMIDLIGFARSIGLDLMSKLPLDPNTQ